MTGRPSLGNRQTSATVIALAGGDGYRRAVEHDNVTSERGRILPLAVLLRRLALPSDQWNPAATLDTFASDARRHLATLRPAQRNGTQP